MSDERLAKISHVIAIGGALRNDEGAELLAALAEAEQERDDLAERVEELHGIVFAFMTRAAEAEQERDALVKQVIAFCARVDGHVDVSQQRHPTWRGVRS